MAATPEDHKTALYVAEKFRAAGLETEIVPYRVLLNWPKVVRVEARDAAGKLLMTGPTREHVQGDPGQDDPRVVMPFNGSSGSGDVTAPVVYANYGRLEDFNKLADLHIDLHGKIVIARYGANFRGVKVYLAEQRGAVGVLLYSDPQDDGYFKGDAYPDGPWRPATGVQRGSVQYLFKYPGDPETPGVASTPDLPDSARDTSANGAQGNQPHIISIPISYHDAAPDSAGHERPRRAAGMAGRTAVSLPPGRRRSARSPRLAAGLPAPHHLGRNRQNQGLRVPRRVGHQRQSSRRVGLRRGRSQQRHRRHARGGARHRCAAQAGLAAQTHHDLLQLGRRGGRPDRLHRMGGATGPRLSTMPSPTSTPMSASPARISRPPPSLRSSNSFAISPSPFPAPWAARSTRSGGSRAAKHNEHRASNAPPQSGEEVHVSDLGSGSDFTPFLQHAGVPSTDVGSEGPYGVYHSTFDDFAWFTQNADPHFVYLQEMARVFGLEALRMADADVLPYDYEAYAREIGSYIDAAERKAADAGLGSSGFCPGPGRRRPLCRRCSQSSCPPGRALGQSRPV